MDITANSPLLLFFRRGLHALLLCALIFAVMLNMGGCSIYDYVFGDDAEQTEEPSDPFAEGMLKAIGATAPGSSSSQLLARIADQFGWEQKVSRNTLLRIAVEEEQFNEKVEPYLLALFYRNGFSVLPQVGQGHQFARDTLVRSAVPAGRFLVTTRELVRIIFLRPVDNVQVVYPRDGTQPLIFTLNEKGVIAVRESLLKEYLR
jgi:hypothetical protein